MLLKKKTTYTTESNKNHENLPKIQKILRQSNYKKVKTHF